MTSTLFSSHASRRFLALALFLNLSLFGIYTGARAAGFVREGAAPAPHLQVLDAQADASDRISLPGSSAIAQAPTPSPTPSPAASPLPPETQAPQRRPTRTPGPTSTPPTIPPPQDPGTTQMMVAFGVLVVVVILFGVWINRKNAF